MPPQVAVAHWANTLTPNQEAELKKAFAEAWLFNPCDPFKAAQSICTNAAITTQIAQDWVFDPIVHDHQRALIKEKGEEFFLPNRTILIRRIMEIGENTETSAKTRLDAYKLIAELLDFMPKPAPPQTNVQVNNNRVMVIKDHGTDAEWAEKLAAQQAKLVASADV